MNSQTRFLIILMAALGLSIYNGVALRAQAHTNCARIETLKSYSEQAIVRAQKTLPTLRYYRHNRRELARTLELLQIQRVQFRPSRCR